MNEHEFISYLAQQYEALGFGRDWALSQATNQWGEMENRARLSHLEQRAERSAQYARWIQKWARRGRRLGNTWFRVNGGERLPTIVLEPI